jgi:hypothetical protein
LLDKINAVNQQRSVSIDQDEMNTTEAIKTAGLPQINQEIIENKSEEDISFSLEKKEFSPMSQEKTLVTNPPIEHENDIPVPSPEAQKQFEEITNSVLADKQSNIRGIKLPENLKEKIKQAAQDMVKQAIELELEKAMESELNKYAENGITDFVKKSA